MVNKAISLVKNFIKEYYPTVDTQDGPFYDLYIKAFAILFDREITKINSNIKDKLDIRNYATMLTTDLDRIAAMYFITRNQGAFASGTVMVYMLSPAKIDLPNGTIFITVSGLKFYASRAISLSAAQTASVRSGKYYTFTVPVSAARKGTEYDVGAGEINGISSSLNIPAVKISNLSATTGGGDSETNAELYLRIVSSVNTRNLLITDSSIKTTIMEAFPTLRQVNVAGKGHDRMQRDRGYSVFSIGGLSPYERSDFWNKRVGTTQYNKNLAYAGRLTSADVSSLDVDDIEAATEQISQEGYYNISALDVNYLTVRGGLEFMDYFTVVTSALIGSSFGLSYDVSNWITSDSGYVFGLTKYGDSVYLSNGYLCMGATPVAELTEVAI